MTAKTLTRYLDALCRLWLVAEQPAWGEHMRSPAQVRRSPKRHLVDPSLAVAALGATPEALIADPEAFGRLFESLAHRDLVVYAQAIGATVHAYQDSSGAEIDAVVVRGEDWAGIEITLSGHPGTVDRAAVHLARIAGRMRTPPVALVVLTATRPSYCRADGVSVVSLLDLAP